MLNKITLVLVPVFFCIGLKAQEYRSQDSPDRSKRYRHFETAPPKNEALQDYDVSSYNLNLEVSPLDTYISGFATMTARSSRESLDTLIMELVQEMKIDSLFLNQSAIGEYLHQEDLVVIPLENPLQAGDIFQVTVHYAGTSTRGGVQSSFNEQYDEYVTWTLSESFHAKDWFPCKEVLTDKADSATVTLTTFGGYTAVSNGLLEKQEELENGKIRFTWKTRYPIEYYLISFAVSDYQEYQFLSETGIPGDSVRIVNYLYDHPDCLSDNKSKILDAKRFMDLFSGLFGPYPFREEKYGHALTEIGGGMEHQTLTTLGNFSWRIVSHELAHQWFGDYVTCGNWQDIWINEGFASYGEYLALEFLDSKQAATDWMSLAHEKAKTKPQGSVYVPFQEARNEARIFDYALSYKKGAALLHMIRYRIGDDDLFFSLLRDFLNLYSHSYATGENFRDLLNERTNIDFNPFFEQWYYGQGFPYYEASWNMANDSLYLTIHQATTSEVTSFFSIPLEVELSNYQHDTLIRVDPNSMTDSWAIPVSFEVSKVSLDPRNYIINGQGPVTKVAELGGDSERFIIYPNPAREIILIQTTYFDVGAPFKVYVYTPTGQKIYAGTLNGTNESIAVSKWKPGLYFLEIVGKNEHLCKKIIKQ